ncbi:MAG: Clp protease N-terminal domain-containing protein [Janthinobacterium lividum]
MRRRTEDAIGPGALDRVATASRRRTRAHLPFTAETKVALSQAVRSAALYRCSEIGSAQLFLGLLADDGTTRRVLHRAGVTASTEELIQQVRAELVRAA